jgi:hypothetical protein
MYIIIDDYSSRAPARRPFQRWKNESIFASPRLNDARALLVIKLNAYSRVTDNLTPFLLKSVINQSQLVKTPDIYYNFKYSTVRTISKR